MKRASERTKASRGLGLILFLVLAVTGQAPAQTCTLITEGGISWWPGNGDANDIIDANDGTLQNGAGYAPGKVGLAFSFSMAGDRVEVPHNPNLSLNLESLNSATFEGWFQSSGADSDAVIVAKHTCGWPEGWFFTTKQGGFIGDHWVGGSGVEGLDLNDGQFHHFAIVKDGTSYYEYIDGTLISSDTGPEYGTPAQGDPPVLIGSIDTGICFPAKHQLDGLVDELGIYNRALTADEIQAIFDAGSAGKCSEVRVDIKPGSDPNCFNNNGHGVIPVAILGEADFDVANIDSGSVELQGLVVAAVGKSNKLLAHYEDVNLDGYEDLVVQIEDNDGVFSEGDSTATVTGKLYDGLPIGGIDSICIVP